MLESWMSWFRERERADGEAFLPPWVRHEHLARYEFAAGYVDGKDVLDCACGDGTGSFRYAERGARRVLAADLSWTQWLTRSIPPQSVVRPCAGDAQSLPVSSGSTDVVVSLETIEHLPAAELFLNEVVRVLRSDGILICSTPDRSVYSPGQGAGDRPWNRFHLREFTANEFAELAGRYFGSVEAYGQNRQSGLLSRWFDRLGGALPGRGAIRVRQAMKMPRFLFDRPARHDVEPAAPDRLYEYRVLVCRDPAGGS